MYGIRGVRMFGSYCECVFCLCWSFCVIVRLGTADPCRVAHKLDHDSPPGRMYVLLPFFGDNDSVLDDVLDFVTLLTIEVLQPQYHLSLFALF